MEAFSGNWGRNTGSIAGEFIYCTFLASKLKSCICFWFCGSGCLPFLRMVLAVAGPDGHRAVMGESGGGHQSKWHFDWSGPAKRRPELVSSMGFISDRQKAKPLCLQGAKGGRAVIMGTSELQGARARHGFIDWRFRYFQQHQPRVPATPVFVAWVGSETSFHLFQCFTDKGPVAGFPR